MNQTGRSSLRSLAAISALVIPAVAALAQTTLYTQLPTAGGGTRRASQLWVDPTGHDDLDSDAIAWENFTLTQAATVTRVQWWGDALPPLGFQLSFYNQDPGTIASQPDMFRPGSGPISEGTYPAPTVRAVAGGLYEFTVDLTEPVAFQPGLRYFISVVGLTPVPYATWGWAQSPTGTSGTFWWMRGAHMYFSLGDNRALVLGGTVACVVDLNQDGLVDFADYLEFLNRYDTQDPSVDFNQDGLVDFADYLEFLNLYDAGC
ncbi:MAG: hypothetical protein IT436_11515 [Phycisphaerales bacterium]|nr:hypothetical protein [Phycisphaerales bacterium]